MSEHLWVERSLGEIASFEYGAALPAGSRTGDEICVYGSNGEVGRHGSALVRGPGIVVGRKGTVGALTWSDDDFWPIDTTYFVSAEPTADLRWLFWILSTLGLSRLDSSTGVPGLNRNDAYAIQVRVPPLDEQRRITKILDTLDDQIRVSAEILTTLAAAREGLVADLTSKGVEKAATLRDRVPHQVFRDSAVGLIPAKWDVAPLASRRSASRPYLKTGPFGSSLKQEHWVDDGVPVVTIGSLGAGTFIESELLHVSEKTAKILSAYALSPGDIVFSRVADVGRSAVATEKERGWIMSSNMMWISLDPMLVDPQFVQINIGANPSVRRQIRRYVNSAGRDVANARVMNLLQFPWPPIEEQRTIVEIVADFDQQVAAERRCLEKLRAVKRGLMADLLTGRVRVPVEAVS